MNQDITEAPEGLTQCGVPATILEYLHACPACLDTGLEHYCRVPSLFNESEFIVYERCRKCGVVLRNPRLPTDYRERRYETVPVSNGDMELKPRNQIHYRYMMRHLLKVEPKLEGTRLLDFGCGSGGFLLEAQEAGFEVMGLELNRDLARHVSHNLGIPTFQGLVTDPEFLSERFRVIVSSQVFEHLVDPRRTLLELHRHLEPSGWILIEVPNLDSYREKVRRGATMNDSHIFYFNSKSLPRLLRACGFRVVDVQEGARLYRVKPELTSRLPDWVSGLGQRVFSTVGLKTGLSVIARTD